MQKSFRSPCSGRILLVGPSQERRDDSSLMFLWTWKACETPFSIGQCSYEWMWERWQPFLQVDKSDTLPLSTHEAVVDGVGLLHPLTSEATDFRCLIIILYCFRGELLSMLSTCTMQNTKCLLFVLILNSVAQMGGGGGRHSSQMHFDLFTKQIHSAQASNILHFFLHVQDLLKPPPWTNE